MRPINLVGRNSAVVGRLADNDRVDKEAVRAPSRRERDTAVHVSPHSIVYELRRTWSNRRT